MTNKNFDLLAEPFSGERGVYESPSLWVISLAEPMNLLTDLSNADIETEGMNDLGPW